jgi:histone H3/H4
LRLSRELGAERISKDAALFISEYLISEMEKIIQKSDKLARHADRKTIMKDDVKLAIEKS